MSEGEVEQAFLAGGGEMGARMRAYAWAETPFGPLADWPQSLRSLVSLCLSAPMPCCILWAPELRVLYNDAYISAIADRHPHALGRPVAEIWGTSWDVVAPRFLRALATGEGFSQTSVEVPMVRHGVAEVTVWDLSAIPVRGEDGSIVALLNQAVETTEQVRAGRVAHGNDERLQQALAAGDGVGTWEWDVPADRVRSDARFARLYGVAPDIAKVGAPIEEFFRRIHPEDFGRVGAAIGEAVATGEIFNEEYRLVDETGAEEWVLARGQCKRADDGTPLEFPGVSFAITARKRADARQAALLELSDRIQDLIDPSEIALAACEVLGRTLGVQCVGYGVVDEAAGTITVEREWNAGMSDTVRGSIPLARFGSSIDALKRGETIAIVDVDLDPRARGHAVHLTSFDARSLVNLPLVEHGRFVALLYARHDAPRGWPADEILLMRQVAERVRSASERVRTNQALLLSEQNLRLALDAGRFGTWTLDLMSGVLDASPICLRAYGFASDESANYGDLRTRIHPDDRLRRQRAHDAAITSGEEYDIEYRVILPSAEVRWLAVRARVSHVDGRDAGVLTGVTSDVTARKRMEEALGALNVELERRVEERTRELVDAQEALRQSQKMEAVGQLTGGIAHDFNNLLQGITGSLQIAQRRIAQGRTDDIARFMQGAITSASRATALTHRLLAFSRRQPLDPRPVGANGLIASLEELFRRTIGQIVTLAVEPAGDLWETLCDPNQLESSLLNLVLNARDAMPNGGTLRIETCNVVVDAAHSATLRNLPPGDYVCISVTDTGCGMAPETVGKVFEPFFTTKPIGQGTGLGLSMVYGFAGQSEGDVSIASAPGQGTTVKIYLPRYTGLAEPEAIPSEPTEPPRAAGETVLVIEDEAVVRGLIVEVLRDLGYDALEAADGVGGLEILSAACRIDLLVTDIGLPGMDGRAVVDAARVERPNLKVLFMTGYAENAARAAGFLKPGMAMLTKPFDVDDLTIRIREMIELP